MIFAGVHRETGFPGQEVVGGPPEPLLRDLQVRYQPLNGVVVWGDVEYIPEPSTLLLLAMGALGITIGRWRRKR